jgi:hypothetical protein
MASHVRDASARVAVLLGALILWGGPAEHGLVRGHGTTASGKTQTAAAAEIACRYCGVVEQVQEIDNKAPKIGRGTVSGGREEMMVMLLSALSGPPEAPARSSIYEVSVRMEDGSVRAFRSGQAPEWSAGDRVKVIKGKIESPS